MEFSICSHQKKKKNEQTQTQTCQQNMSWMVG
jgi:hypothetical protein